MPPSLSLCLIVRDVQDHIARCLESVKDHVDEILVTDTGSTDGTIAEVLRVCPKARVFKFLADEHPAAYTLDVEESWEKKLPGPFSGKRFLSDFSAARQFAWKDAKSDFLMWLDSDDVVVGAEKLRETLDHMSKHDIDMAMLNYDYDHNPAGQVTMRLPRERIVARRAEPYWAQPVHEVLLAKSARSIGVFYPDVSIKHQRREWKTKSVVEGRNLKILVKWFEQQKKEGKKESDLDPRMIFYLAMEERFHWPEAALAHFKMYVAKSGWDEERALAHLLSGRLHEYAARWLDAMASYSIATVEFPDNPDGFFGLARVAYFKKDWGKCVEWTERAFEVDKKGKRRPTMLMEDPHDRSWRPYVYYTAALVNTGQYKKCIEAANEGLKYAPDEPHLKGNKEASETNLAAMEEKRSAGPSRFAGFVRRDEPLENPPIDIPFEVRLIMALQLWKRTLANNVDRAMNLLTSLPDDLIDDPKVKEAVDFTRKCLAGEISVPKGEKKIAETPEPEVEVKVEEKAAEPPVDEKLEEARVPSDLSVAKDAAGSSTVVEVSKRLMKIVLWTGPAWETWSPASLESGIGGSETAAIHMARGLARRGHQVKVLGMCDGRWDGVEYVHHEKALSSPDDYVCDVLIASRQPKILAENIFRAKAMFVWVHDVHCGHGTQISEGLLRADKIFALSRWHKEFLKAQYPFLNNDAFHVTRNGIDVARFGRVPHKVGKKIIVTSSLDRYLERMLELFPKIKAQVPETELHIYYGWKLWEDMSRQAGDQAQLDKIERYKAMLEDAKPTGVFCHGRVGQTELAEAFLESAIWAYPTWFSETSCISAMEAQAAGCVPVTSALAALEETVRYGYLFKGRDTDEGYKDAFVGRVVALLKNEAARREIADAGRRYALKNFSWEGVVTEWESMFAAITADKMVLSLPSYGGL